MSADEKRLAKLPSMQRSNTTWDSFFSLFGSYAVKDQWSMNPLRKHTQAREIYGYWKEAHWYKVYSAKVFVVLFLFH